MKKTPKTTALAIHPDKRLDALADSIVQVVREARASVAKHVNTAMVSAYWLIGRHIVEFE